MEFLKKCKRMWLLPFVMYLLLALALLYFYQEYSVCKTIALMILITEAIIIFEFLLIILFKWKTWCRRIAIFIFLAVTIYFSIKGYIARWYIIVPISVILLLYMCWILGGIKNCMVASLYMSSLHREITSATQSYGHYFTEVDELNASNNLGFFSKVRKKKEPNWNKYRFNETDLNMFSISTSFQGIDTDRWEKNIKKVKKYNYRLNENISAINIDTSLREELDILKRVIHKREEINADNPDLSEQKDKLNCKKKKNLKQIKKILKKRL